MVSEVHRRVWGPTVGARVNMAGYIEGLKGPRRRGCMHAQKQPCFILH